MKKTILLSALMSISMLLNAQTEAPAVLFHGTDGTDESYLLTDDISLSFEDGEVYLMVGGEKVSELDVDEEDIVDIDFRTAYIMSGTSDPASSENCFYSTFFSSEGAYKLPEEGVTAYAGMPEGGALKMNSIGSIIAQGEPVLLRATSESFVLMPSGSTIEPSAPNALAGTDSEMMLGDGDYALSLGQDGIGFYPWDGKTIADNNAYLPFGSQYPVSSLTLKFDDTPTAIDTPHVAASEPGLIYNLNGMRVGKDYKGIVVKNGKRIILK